MDITKIYLVTNCYEDSNKVYIGKEKFSKKNSREIDHKRKFGKNIIFTYIDEINSIDHSNWKPLECFWIEYFRQLGFNLMNENTGGTGPSFQTDETKIKISQKLKGSKRSDDIKYKMKFNNLGRICTDKTKEKLSKKVYQYDLEGNLIKIWKSLSETVKETGYNLEHVSGCCVGKYKRVKNSIFRYENNLIDENFKPIILKPKGISQYDLEGNFIKNYKDMNEVIKEFGNKNNIFACCEGIQNTAKGYKWKREDI